MKKSHQMAVLVVSVVLGGAVGGCGTDTSATVIIPATPTRAAQLVATQKPTATPIPRDG